MPRFFSSPAVKWILYNSTVAVGSTLTGIVTQHYIERLESLNGGNHRLSSIETSGGKGSDHPSEASRGINPR